MRRTFSEQRNYYLARWFGIKVPVFPLVHLPDGFSVQHVGKTGLALTENFCTADEADYLIEKARNLLVDSRIVIDNKPVKDSYRTSQTAMVFDPFHKDPSLLPLLYRGAMLLGVPHSHVETIFVTRYRSGEYYKAHEDFFAGFHGDRLYTILIYLNDLRDDQGGETVFEKLNLAVRPKLGRAVAWTNTDPDGSVHPETRHEAMPVAEGTEKWAIQLWFRNYEMIKIADELGSTPQTARGEPLSGDEVLPDGVSAPGEFSADTPYGRAFS